MAPNNHKCPGSLQRAGALRFSGVRPQRAAQQLTEHALEKSDSSLRQKSGFDCQISPHAGGQKEGFQPLAECLRCLPPPGKVAPSGGDEPGRPDSEQGRKCCSHCQQHHKQHGVPGGKSPAGQLMKRAESQYNKGECQRQLSQNFHKSRTKTGVKLPIRFRQSACCQLHIHPGGRVLAGIL